MALPVLGLHGMTIVHATEGSDQIYANVRVTDGRLMMMATSACQFFLAFLNPALTEPLIRREICHNVIGTGPKFDEPWYRADAAAVRVRSYARPLNTLIPGASASVRS